MWPGFDSRLMQVISSLRPTVRLDQPVLRAQRGGWQWHFDTRHDDKISGRSLWVMTGWHAGHYGWWQWHYDTSHDDRMTSGSLWLMTMTAHGDKRQQSAASAGQRRHNTIRHHFYHSAAKQNPNIYSGLNSSYLPVFSLFVIRFDSLASYTLKVSKDLV